MIGLSLAVFGILHALAQAFVITGPATKRFGEKQPLSPAAWRPTRWATSAGVRDARLDGLPIMILASGGIGMPALQAMLSRQVDDDHQGQLQGSLAALTSLTSIIGPLIVTAFMPPRRAHGTGWHGLWRRPIPCLARVASRCMEPGHLDLNGSRRHLANGFTTPRIGANQFLRRTVNAQTNPWQNISIASAISSSRTRRISAALSWPRCA